MRSVESQTNATSVRLVKCHSDGILGNQESEGGPRRHVRQIPFSLNAEPVCDPGKEDDAALAHALIAGDPQAPRLAWVRFAPMVRRMLTRALGPGNDVEDIQQDIFIAFFRQVLTLRQPASLRAFIQSIAVRTIKYEFRRRRVRRVLSFWGREGDLPAEARGRHSASPDPSTRQALRAFYAILERLNARDRTMFCLRYLDEMEVVRVADTVGVSVSTAKRRLGRTWRLVALRVRKDQALSGVFSSTQSTIDARQTGSPAT